MKIGLILLEIKDSDPIREGHGLRLQEQANEKIILNNSYGKPAIYLY